MGDRRMQKEGRAAFWRAVMEAFKTSGMTVAVFCKQEGLTASSFYLWRKQLARTDADSSQGAKAKVKPVKPTGRAKLSRQRNGNEPFGFVEVASLGGHAPSGLTISFPGEVSIAAAPSCDVELLRQAVMILSERPC